MSSTWLSSYRLSSNVLMALVPICRRIVVPVNRNTKLVAMRQIVLNVMMQIIDIALLRAFF
jgi:hypothetical protein